MVPRPWQRRDRTGGSQPTAGGWPGADRLGAPFIGSASGSERPPGAGAWGPSRVPGGWGLGLGARGKCPKGRGWVRVRVLQPKQGSGAPRLSAEARAGMRGLRGRGARGFGVQDPMRFWGRRTLTPPGSGRATLTAAASARLRGPRPGARLRPTDPLPPPPPRLRDPARQAAGSSPETSMVAQGPSGYSRHRVPRLRREAPSGRTAVLRQQRSLAAGRAQGQGFEPRSSSSPAAASATFFFFLILFRPSSFCLRRYSRGRGDHV